MAYSPEILFDALASGYEKMRAELDWDPFIHIRAALGDRSPQGMAVLDAGCGTGETDRWLASLGALPYGIDISAEMCMTAAELSENIPFLPHDLNDPLPFDDNRFDMAIALGCMEYLPDPAPAVREFSRVLNKTGVFVGCFERFGMDCPGGRNSSVLMFDNWVRYRQSEDTLRELFSSLFECVEMEKVPGFILEETQERTQYWRVIAHSPKR